jgi:uncharacterized membrane protein YqjE
MADRFDRDAATDMRDRPAGELVKEAAQQTARLVRQEIRLAQLELTEKGKRAGIGAGLFGGAGLVALYGVGALVAAAMLLLAKTITAWLAGAIVGVALLLVAGLLALTGRKQVGRATPPAPERAIESVQRDVDEVRARARRT